MKRYFRIVLAAILVAMMGLPAVAQRRQNLRILYLSGSSNEDTFQYYPAKTEEELNGVAERAGDFEKFLKKHFKSVTVLESRQYKPEMSENYDVTIVDGYLPVLEKSKRLFYEDGSFKDFIPAVYFPSDYSCPTLSIGDCSSLGVSLGCMNDWCCQCLEADAYNFKAGHPVFNTPYKVRLTTRLEQVPAGARMAARNSGEQIPDSVQMWRVQEKSYSDDPKVRAGLVSSYNGYDEAPDAEVISGGVSAKPFGAVAMGRHGNFFHWGFSAAPSQMTEEARKVFVNAVVYISQKGNSLITRSLNERVICRDEADAEAFSATRKAWEMSQENATAEELLTYGEYLQDLFPQLYPAFGNETAEYVRYFQRNKPYFYGNYGYVFNLVVDDDIKELGISNGDIRLLEKAISMWESGDRPDMAKRILKRYTLCRFERVQDWRNWFETYKDRLFFTERGGWLWLVNECGKEVPGNDYSVLEHEDPEQILNLVESGSVNLTSPADPVYLSVSVDYPDDDVYELSANLLIHNGFHIYAKVAGNEPYIPVSVEFLLPDGMEAVGGIEASASKVLTPAGTTGYEHSCTFKQTVKGKFGGNVICRISYQSCNEDICLAPAQKERTVEL